MPIANKYSIDEILDAAAITLQKQAVGLHLSTLSLAGKMTAKPMQKSFPRGFRISTVM